LIRRNSYVRIPNTDRRHAQKTRYKKGWEIRLVLKDEDELMEARRLIERAGFPVARAFRKEKQLVQPVYGKAAFEAFGIDTRRQSKGKGV
jgi:hypothetical protein